MLILTSESINIFATKQILNAKMSQQIYLVFCPTDLSVSFLTLSISLIKKSYRYSRPHTLVE